MAKGNPLQEQLLKAGLVKKSKVAAVAREQHVARDRRDTPVPSEAGRAAEQARVEKAARDRALEAARRAQARTVELAAQARQIVADKKVPRTGENPYRFPADGAIRTLLIDEPLRRQLATGALVIARFGDGYELLPRVAADKVIERDPTVIVLDHGRADAPPATDAADDAYYAQFVVPDDLVW